MYESKMTFKLKQETPIVHFQFDDPEAIIRSTELKPKLDSFLKKKYGSKLEKNWYLKNTSEEAALNYKVRVYSDTLCETPAEPQRGDMYFGNMGDDAQIKKYVFYREPVTFEIVCLYRGLRAFIKESLPEFFLVTNFGTRQSKGYGCFTLLGVSEDCLSLLNDKGYKFFYCDVESSKYQDKMFLASVIYSVMKGGINRSGYNKGQYKNPRAYVKGFIQREYIDSLPDGRNIGSDKALIKRSVIPNFKNLPEHGNSPKLNYKKYYFFRALLGLADHYEFKDDIRRGNVQIKNDDIQRFKSPITISFVGNRLYFIFDDSYKPLLGKTFVLENDRISKNRVQVQVPSVFDVKDFIHKFVDYYNSPEVGEALYELGGVNSSYDPASEITLFEGGI